MCVCFKGESESGVLVEISKLLHFKQAIFEESVGKKKKMY